jgi:hypothetical protein
MKKFMLLGLLAVLLACNKDDSDQCQEDQAKCNGFTYDCETKACLCAHPYEGAFCDEYYYEKFKGMYYGQKVVYGFGLEIDSVQAFFYISSPNNDSVFGNPIDWVSNSSFNILDPKGSAMGAGTAQENGEIELTWEDQYDPGNGKLHDRTTTFKGNRIY